MGASCFASQLHMRRNIISAYTLASAFYVTCGHGFRVAFIADTGIGNDRPSDAWTDYLGNLRQPSYTVDGVECKNYKGEYCGAFSRARDVFELARGSGAELVIHAGDLDYESSPTSWLRFLTEEAFRPGLGYLASQGNHDVDGWDGVSDLWSGPRGYKTLLSRQIPRGASCRGSYGEDYACEYKGVLFVLSSVGSVSPGESANRAHYDFVENALRTSDAKWKICVWHMTMNSLQSSYKGDATGFGIYEICRKYGAFIVTGHAHTYSRSYTMKSFGTRVYGFTRQDLQVASYDKSVITLKPGEQSGTTGIAVVGIGGYKNEAQQTDSGIWAKVYSSSCSSSSCEYANDAHKYGALICEFAPTESTAPCYLATTARRGATAAEKQRRARVKVDEFTLVRQLGSNPSSSVLQSPRIPSSGACDDVPPDSTADCTDQARWGKCDRDFLIRGNYCRKSCKRCS